MPTAYFNSATRKLAAGRGIHLILIALWIIKGRQDAVAVCQWARAEGLHGQIFALVAQPISA